MINKSHTHTHTHTHTHKACRINSVSSSSHLCKTFQRLHFLLFFFLSSLPPYFLSLPCFPHLLTTSSHPCFLSFSHCLYLLFFFIQSFIFPPFLNLSTLPPSLSLLSSSNCSYFSFLPSLLFPFIHPPFLPSLHLSSSVSLLFLYLHPNSENQVKLVKFLFGSHCSYRCLVFL